MYSLSMPVGLENLTFNMDMLHEKPKTVTELAEYEIYCGQVQGLMK